MPLEASILNTTKKVLQISPDDPSFDQDIFLHINSAFSDLSDLGIGPLEGFFIEDDTTTWSAYVDEPIAQSKIKTFVYLKVRLIFDPPESSYALAAAEKQLDQVTWRLSVLRESTEWAAPVTDSALVIDGGDPSGV